MIMILEFGLLSVTIPGQGRKDHRGTVELALPHYSILISIHFSPVARTLFPVNDDHVLRFLFEDNQKIEPEWYCPIIPMVLVNGASGKKNH